MAKIFVINDTDLSSIESVSMSDEIRQKSALESKPTAKKKSNISFVGHENQTITPISNTNSSDNHEQLGIVDIIENSIGSDDIPNDERSESQENLQLSLEDEKKLYHQKGCKREEAFKCIVLNERIEFSWEACLCYLYGIVLIGVLSTTPTSLIPAHDLLLFPERWFEALFLGWIVPTACYLYYCVLSESILNLSYMIQKRNILRVVTIGVVVFMTLFLGSFFIWTQLLEYQFPVPFLVVMGIVILNISLIPILWFRFPQKWRENSGFQKRMMFFSFFIVLGPAIEQIYTLTLEKLRNSENQHFVALALPVIREIYVWIASKLVDNCHNGDERRTKIFIQYAISNRHAIILCYVIGSFATDTTSWILMAVDFSLNIFLCIQIVWSKKRKPYEVQKQTVLLQDLAVYELVEFHGPLSFILVTVLAYYGPNAEIIGNIGNSYWAFNRIEDIHKTLPNMGLFFLIDFSSTLTSAIILWFTCRINLWKAFYVIQKEFGKSFCVTQIFMLVVVRTLSK